MQNFFSNCAIDEPRLCDVKCALCMQNSFVFKLITRVRVCWCLWPRSLQFYGLLGCFPFPPKLRKLINWCQSCHKKFFSIQDVIWLPCLPFAVSWLDSLSMGRCWELPSAAEAVEVMVSKRPSITYYPKENQVLGLQAFLDQQLHTTETHLTTPKTIIPPGMVTKLVVTQFRAKNDNPLAFFTRLENGP